MQNFGNFSIDYYLLGTTQLLSSGYQYTEIKAKVSLIIVIITGSIVFRILLMYKVLLKLF